MSSNDEKDQRILGLRPMYWRTKVLLNGLRKV